MPLDRPLNSIYLCVGSRKIRQELVTLEHEHINATMWPFPSSHSLVSSNYIRVGKKKARATDVT